MTRFSGFLLALPLAAQSLSLACPPPQKFNQPAVCSVNFSGGAVSLQWKMTTSPAVSVAVASSVPGKSLASSNGNYLLAGMNATNISGQIATVTIPAHSGTVTITLSGPLGSSASGHAVPVSPATVVVSQ